MFLKKVKKVVLREVHFFFLTLFLLGLGALPFLTGHFTITSPNNYQTKNTLDQNNENFVLNDEAILISNRQKQSSLLKLGWDEVPSTENNQPIINDYFLYSIYFFLILFMVYPVRYIMYILNTLLE